MRYETQWEDALVRAVANPVADVRQIEIVPAGGVVAYAPGSHLQVGVVLQDGGAMLPDVRSYSLVGAEPQDGAYRIAVRRQPQGRGGSRYMATLQPGARLRISNPQNLFALDYGRPQYLLIAGGIGITPLLGMAQALQKNGANFRLLYSARHRAGMPYTEELCATLGPHLGLYCGEDGSRFDLKAEIDALHPHGELYMCGPIGLMDAVRRAWKNAGRQPTRLRFETFGSSGQFPVEAFTVKVADRDVEVRVPENKTMLQALQEAHVDVMYDCLRGECGLCAVTVLGAEGRLDHRDVFLSVQEKAAGDKICSCVSRAVDGPITIDTGYRPTVAAPVSPGDSYPA